jgi:hypothetical protein
MALPKIASTVHTFKTLNGKKINFRAFKVGDEQSLLEAKESGDNEIIVNTVLEVLQNIVISKIDIRTLPIYEVEHLLLSARIASVGNISKVKIKCDCGKHTPVELDLSKAYIYDGDKKDPNIELGQEEGTGETVVLHMKYPTFEFLSTLRSTEQKSILRICIDSITVGENNYTFEDSTDEELDEWLSSLTKDKLVKVFEFIKGMPSMRLQVNEKCIECGKDIDMEFKEFETFFT